MDLKVALFAFIEAAVITLLVLRYTTLMFFFVILPMAIGFVAYYILVSFLPDKTKMQRIGLCLLAFLAEAMVASAAFSTFLPIAVMLPISVVSFLVASIYFDLVYLFKEPSWSTNVLVPYGLYLTLMLLFYKVL